MFKREPKLYIRSQIKLENKANVFLVLAKSNIQATDYKIQWSWAGYTDDVMIDSQISKKKKYDATIKLLKKAVVHGYLDKKDLPLALKNNKIPSDTKLIIIKPSIKCLILMAIVGFITGLTFL